MKSGSFADLNRNPVSPWWTERVERSSFANSSFQSKSPTLVIAVESTIDATALGAEVGEVLTAVVFAGGVAGTRIGALHFGQGKVCPSICSWRTMILLEQWGQASRKGSTGGTEPRQWKKRSRQYTYSIPAVLRQAKAASHSDGNYLSLVVC